MEMKEFSPKLVCDWLLHRGYKLTALELLVESEQAGKLDEVIDLQVRILLILKFRICVPHSLSLLLQLFFSDPNRFPQEEISRYQSQNALDVQALARDREERLQMAEYELRLAKEDLDDLRTRAQHATRMKHVGIRELRSSEGEAHQQLQGDGPSHEAEIHSPHSLRISIASEDLNPSPSTTPGTTKSNIDPSSLRVINSAVLSHLLKNRLKMTALTLQDEAGLGDEGLPALSSRTKGDLDDDDADGMEIWKWMQAAEREKKHRQQLHRHCSSPPKGLVICAASTPPSLS